MFAFEFPPKVPYFIVAGMIALGAIAQVKIKEHPTTAVVVQKGDHK